MQHGKRNRLRGRQKKRSLERREEGVVRSENTTSVMFQKQRMSSTIKMSSMKTKKNPPNLAIRKSVTIPLAFSAQWGGQMPD